MLAKAGLELLDALQAALALRGNEPGHARSEDKGSRAYRALELAFHAKVRGVDVLGERALVQQAVVVEDHLTKCVRCAR